MTESEEELKGFLMRVKEESEKPGLKLNIQKMPGKEINPEYSLEGLMPDTEAPILCLPDAKSWLTGKDPDAGQDWLQEEKGVTDDETVGEHHWLNGHEFEQTPGDSERQGILVCCSPGGRRVRHN